MQSVAIRLRTRSIDEALFALRLAILGALRSVLARATT